MATVSYDQSAAAKAGGFGWSLAVINSNPELKALFAQATATGPNGGWTTDHFVAKVRDTKWFKTHADTARQAIILQKADPATYNARVGSAAAQVTNMAGTVGARMTAAQVQQIGVGSGMFGGNADQLRDPVPNRSPLDAKRSGEGVAHHRLEARGPVLGAGDLVPVRRVGDPSRGRTPHVADGGVQVDPVRRLGQILALHGERGHAVPHR